MKVYLTEVERMLRQLPIGYYANERVEVKLDPEGYNSFIDLINKNIVISYPLIAESLKECVDETCKETAVRSMLYHEVGHAIMTPSDLKIDALTNIFEDERLETLLNGFFLNVDFKNNIKRINGWDDKATHEPAKDAQDAFYRAVRYRYGRPQWIKEVEYIIRDFHDIDSNTTSHHVLYTYKERIKGLYDMIAREYKTDVDNNKTNYDAPQSAENTDITSSNRTELPNVSTSDQTTMNDIVREVMGKMAYTMKNINVQYHDPALISQLSMIINNFNRRNSSGNAYQAYSGVLNPRLANRPDYRMFERASAERGTNKFGTVHLNLFLDYSASFRGNQTIVNKLINALAEIGKYNKNFSFDICYCGESEYIADKKNLAMRCGGCNDLDKKIFDYFRRLQKPNTYNYNIVLFDGDAFSISRRPDVAQKNFSAFNKNNVTIISDYSNRRAIEKYAPAAHTIITADYSTQLIKNVVNVLQLAFH